MPFAGYEDFEACVADNTDKEDPEAYCAALEAAAKPDAASNDVGTFTSTMRFELVPVITEVAYKRDEDDDTFQVGADFHAVMIVEGAWTGDGRYIESGALTWRDLPLPLMAIDRTTEGHMDAVLIGNFTSVERIGSEIHGYGTFVASDDPDTQRLQALVRNGDLRGHLSRPGQHGV
jgi:hypothetical protein